MSLAKVMELRNERATLVAEMRKLIDFAEGEKRAFSAEEQTKYDKMEADVRGLKDRVEREERLAVEEAGLRDLPGAPGKGNPTESTPEEKRTLAFRNFLASGDAEEYRALANDTGTSGGYLHAPKNAQSPYAIVGNHQRIEGRVLNDSERKDYVDIHLWAHYRGKAQVSALAEKVEQRILSLERPFFLEDIESLNDDGSGWSHGVISFRTYDDRE